MSNRNQTIAAFMERSGFGHFTRISLGDDASTRRYDKLVHGDETYILMDAPPSADVALEGQICTPGMNVSDREALGHTAKRRLAGSRVDAFVCINGWLEQNGFSVPHVYAFDVESGLAILEDLGDGQYWALLNKSRDQERAMYEAATDAAIRLDQIEPPQVLEYEGASWPLLTFDKLVVMTEAELFLEWYAGNKNGVEITPEVRAEYQAAWEDIASLLTTRMDRLITRDYHSPNLMWLPDREGYRRAGILDHQDALISHPAYNLMFLLNDPRRDVPEQLQQDMLERYFAGTGFDRADFMRYYAAFQALQSFRIAGVFWRLNVRDNKPGYMVHMHRLERYIRASLSHPSLARLRRWIDTYLPDFMNDQD